MLLTFSVSNFRSFLGEQTFSLVANRRLTDHLGHLADVPGLESQVLRIGVLYGANASGKSNLVAALQLLAHLGTQWTEGEGASARQPFAGPGGEAAPTVFDLQLLLGDKVIRYGLELTDACVDAEWLVEVRGAKEIPYFERDLDDAGRSRVRTPRTWSKLEALANIGVKRNQTFLATARKLLETPDLPDGVSDLLAWFGMKLSIIRPESRLLPITDLVASFADLRQFTGDFLREVSTGIEGLEVEETPTSLEELRLQLESDSFQELRHVMATRSPWRAVLSLKSGRDLSLRGAADGSIVRLSLKPLHRFGDQAVKMEIEQESDGTRRLLDLLPALALMHNDDGVFVIDEIDRSLHPLLVRQFVQFFLEQCGVQRSQLIFTTHESSLLDFDLLRRDEIWFTEKDGEGASHLYSLMDFKERKDADVRKHYLEGRFGAVPFVGGLERLRANPIETEPHA